MRMKKDDAVSPIVVISGIGLLLAACCGLVVEGAVGKKNPFRKLSISLIMVPLIVIAIHMIITKRAFYKSHEAKGLEAILFGGFILLLTGSIFIFLTVDALKELGVLP